MCISQQPAKWLMISLLWEPVIHAVLLPSTLQGGLISSTPEGLSFLQYPEGAGKEHRQWGPATS